MDYNHVVFGFLTRARNDGSPTCGQNTIPFSPAIQIAKWAR